MIRYRCTTQDIEGLEFTFYEWLLFLDRFQIVEDTNVSERFVRLD